jgi:hypothetical protein
LIAIFRIHKKFELVFVNIHFKSDKDQANALLSLVQTIKNTIGKIKRRIFIYFNIRLFRTKTRRYFRKF